MAQKNLIYLGIFGFVAYLFYKKFYTKVSDFESKEVLKDWKKNFDSKDIEAIVKNYSEDGILVSTFGDILTGRNAIKNYFIGLFKKDKLGVNYINQPQITDLNGATTLTGLYEFRYSEKGQMNKTIARYSFILKKINGKIYIIKQHSSVAN
jgi:hypothetical protein